MKFGYVFDDGADSVSYQINKLQHHQCEQWLIESADDEQRPQRNALLSQLTQGDELMVWRLDMLADSIQELVTFITELQLSDIKLVSVWEKIGLNGDYDDNSLVFAIMCLMADFERNVLSRTTKRGIQRSNKRSGRPSSISDEILKKAHWLIGQKMSVEQAADQLNVSRSALYRALNKR